MLPRRKLNRLVCSLFFILIRKAVELGELTYPQLMARLVEDPAVLMQIRRELGLPEE